MDHKAARAHPVHPLVNSRLEREETHLPSTADQGQGWPGCQSRAPDFPNREWSGGSQAPPTGEKYRDRLTWEVGGYATTQSSSL